MNTINVLTRTRTKLGRRLALDLLAALAITLGAVAAPLLAGTAHASGASGGVELRGPGGSVGNTGTAPGPNTAHPGGGQTAGPVAPTGGSKPSIINDGR